MSQLRIDVSDLIRVPGASMEISTDARVPGLHAGHGWVEEEKGIELQLVAESVHDGVAVGGSLRGSYGLVCSRCLKGFEAPFEHRVDETFAERDPDADYQIEAGTIDLSALVRDVVLLSIPQVPLHDPRCRGLCPVCGVDRNEEECGHDAEPADDRWGPLAQLFGDERR